MSRYYDAVLGLIPLVLFGLTGVLSIAGVTLTSAVSISAAGALLLVGHALFVNAPVSSGTDASDRTREEQSQSSRMGPINAD